MTAMPYIVLAVFLIIVVLLFIIDRNRKDKKQLVKELNERKKIAWKQDAATKV